MSPEIEALLLKNHYVVGSVGLTAEKIAFRCGHFDSLQLLL